MFAVKDFFRLKIIILKTKQKTNVTKKFQNLNTFFFKFKEKNPTM